MVEFSSDNFLQQAKTIQYSTRFIKVKEVRFEPTTAAAIFDAASCYSLLSKSAAVEERLNCSNLIVPIPWSMKIIIFLTIAVYPIAYIAETLLSNKL
jgi:hypothetical protein